MKKITLLLIIITISGCFEQAGMPDKFKKEEFEGHSYVVYINTGKNVFVHDPDCKSETHKRANK